MERFVNSLSHVSNPLSEYRDFEFVPWDKSIYPKFKGETRIEEIEFIFNLISERKLGRIVDFAVGKGTELSGIVQMASDRQYVLHRAEANELSDEHMAQSRALFDAHEQSIVVHKADWQDLPDAHPEYSGLFDFGYLTGNSIALLGGGTRDYSRRAQSAVISNFAKLIDDGGYIFIDHRNYDYILSLINTHYDNIAEGFTFDYTVYYHGAQKSINVIPAYISETLIVLHYYDLEDRIWSKLDYCPIYHDEMLSILNHHFTVEKVFHDFELGANGKSMFVQYLAKKN
jgi:hypothetical protein